VQPRVGLSAVLQPGSVTLKLRSAYGRAIRAPAVGLASASVGAFGTDLANPLLRPERQRGWDTGVDLIFGNRGSLSLTWYNQIADDLIVQVVTAISPVLTTQFQNVGRVANRGLEVEGTLELHPLQLRAQYAYTNSRIQDLGSATGTGLTVGGRPQSTPVHTAGATVTAAPWRTGTVSLGGTYVGGYHSLDFLAFARCLGGTGPCPTPFIFSNFQRDYSAFAKANLNVTQRITSHVDGLLSIDNLTNNMAFEGSNISTVMGRTTMVGLHARF
jgi:outer membrane receptor protein involved in Fe transport